MMEKTESKSVPFYSQLLKECDMSTHACLLLSNCLYHLREGADTVERTCEEVIRETGLTRWQQTSARKKLEQLGLIEFSTGGFPCRRRFKIKMEKIGKTN